MKPPIVDTNHAVTLCGGAEVQPKVVSLALRFAPNLVAADGGAGAVLRLGHIPQAVIGDFDSLDADIIAQIPSERIHRIPEQQTTDFDKCLRNIRAPYILAVGFTGGRLDHELAVYNVLTKHPDQPCVVLGAVDLCLLVTDQLRLTLPVGTRVSLFPMGACNVSATGLRWPVEGLEMAPDGQIGTSNEATGGEITVQTTAPKLLLILPLEHLDAVIAALG